jgi:hypothetical protein
MKVRKPQSIVRRYPSFLESYALISESNLLLLHSRRWSTLVSLPDSPVITTLLRPRCCDSYSACRQTRSFFSYLSPNTGLPERNDLFILSEKPVVDCVGRLTKCSRELAFPQNLEYLDFGICQSRG